MGGLLMNKENDDIQVEIIYKNDIEARNKLIDFIINLILDSNELIGDIDDCRFETNEKRGDRKYDHKS